MTTVATSKAQEYLGAEAESLLTYQAKGFDKSTLHLPGPDFLDRTLIHSDRKPQVLRNYQTILNTGRLAGTGYVSILPVDQGVEHSAGASFAPAPIYFDPENIVKLAIEGGCNCVVSTLGVLGAVARLMLDNIAHIKAFWIATGVGVAQAALWYGADDLDGTVQEERIYHMAGSDTPEVMTTMAIRRLIAAAGREPHERDTLYNLVGEAAPAS